MECDDHTLRPTIYMGSSRKDLEKLPKDVKDIFLQGLYIASIGDTPQGSKPLKGFGGRRVVELVEDHKGDTDPEPFILSDSKK